MGMPKYLGAIDCVRYSEYLEIYDEMGDWFTIDQMSYFENGLPDSEHRSLVMSGDLIRRYGGRDYLQDEEMFNIELKYTHPDISLSDNYTSRKKKMRFHCVNCNSSFESVGESVINSGCPKCRKGRYAGENTIEKLLEDLGLFFYKQESDGCINPKTGKELKYDFIVEWDKTLYIEVNGMQHYKSIEFFGGEIAHEGVLYRDKIKREYANKNGVYIELDYREHNIELLTERFNEKMNELGVM